MTTHLLSFARVACGENMPPFVVKRIKPDYQPHLLVFQEQLKKILPSQKR